MNSYLIVTFGKYKDKHITELLADDKYVDWLKSQDCFLSEHKYKSLNAYINKINNLIIDIKQYHVLLGAIDIISGKYVLPKVANKKNSYTCPECITKVILCQGKINAYHFRHKIDSSCTHYESSISESIIHKDAKLLLKTLLETNISPIKFIRNCSCCYNKITGIIPILSSSSKIELEYRFDYNGLKIADVAYITDDKLCYIFEICYKNVTLPENRPEPWFEIDAISLLNLTDRSNILLSCIRKEKCNVCIKKDKKIEGEILKDIRIKLGQTQFLHNAQHCDSVIDCNYCAYCVNYEEHIAREYNIKQGRHEDDARCLYYDHEVHILRGCLHDGFNFDADDDIEHNKAIMDIFNPLFKYKKAVIHSHKGGIDAIIVSNNDYKKYNADFWNYYVFHNMRTPNYSSDKYDKYDYVDEINIDCGTGTVEIIRMLYDICN